jgi:peptidoglycan-N-acetylglucosamine deacetylase
MKNALSIDLEFWYSAELVRPYAQEGNDLIIEMTRPILDLLDLYDTKATFFVLGEVAEKYPEIIKEIYDKGHEIGSHSYSHRTLQDLGRSGFEYEVEKSLNVLKRITGDNIKGFRAPTFSLNNGTIWGLDVLEKFKFVYDSSIFPIKSPLYGVPKAPLHPYFPSHTDLGKEDKSSGYKIIEIPLTVYKLGLMKIPISGGFYLRVIPFQLLRTLIKKSMNNGCIVIYLHPWELIPIAPRLKLPLFSKFVTYCNIDSTISKLESLLTNFSFGTMQEIVSEF